MPWDQNMTLLLCVGTVSIHSQHHRHASQRTRTQIVDINARTAPLTLQPSRISSLCRLYTCRTSLPDSSFATAQSVNPE